jgi:formate hydrogenlyase transcriptional activator
MVDERQFRADLFYRLSVFPIELPPLRDRPEDIRLLAHRFAMAYAARMRKPIVAIADQFMADLSRHSWPGNVRELQNFMERSVILSKDVVLNGSLPETPYTNPSTPVTMEDAERSHILQTLQQTGGAVGGPNGAAVRLGLPRTTLIAKMQRLGINGRRIRTPPLKEFARAGASSGNSAAHSDLGRMYAPATPEEIRYAVSRGE